MGSPKPLIGNFVKHLLIILSILLLSSPLFGQETGVLYLWDTSSGQVWKTFRDKDTQPKYKGQVENGKPNGQGTYTFNDGRKYVGNWIDGEQNGQGTLTSPNGEKYEGEWKDGLPNGKGVFTFGKGEWEGDKYIREHKDGEKHGQGTLTSPDGDMYEGEFKDGKYDGQGTYTWSDGRKYVGEWLDGKQNGHGTVTSPDGKYVGEWKGNDFHGQGTMISTDGTKWVGEFRENKRWNIREYDNYGNLTTEGVNGVEQTGIKWKTFGNEKVQPKYDGEIKNGKIDGLGVLTYPYDGKSIVGEWKNGKEWNTKHTKKDGTLLGKFENGEWIVSWGVLDYFDESKYEGEIKNRLPNGQGTMTYTDGVKYVGEYKDGKRHGQGTYTFPDGKKYVGGWKDSKYHGQGTLTSSDGKYFVGEFKDSKPWNITGYDKNGNIKRKWVNGK